MLNTFLVRFEKNEKLILEKNVVLRFDVACGRDAPQALHIWTLFDVAPFDSRNDTRLGLGVSRGRRGVWKMSEMIPQSNDTTRFVFVENKQNDVSF